MFEQSKQGTVNVIRADNPVNGEYVDTLRAILERHAEVGQPSVVFDMQAVPLVDSAGLELLLDTRDMYRKRGGTLKLASANPLCLEILNVTGVGRLFEMFNSANAAVGSFGR